jgi:hypothetical protein
MKLGEVYDRYQEKLDKLSEKLCDLNNKYILNIGEDDLDLNIPLWTNHDVEKNKKAVKNYAFLVLGATFGTLGACYGIASEAVDVFNSHNVAEITTNIGHGLPYVMLGDISVFLSKKFNDKVEILQNKRNLEESLIG